MVRAFSGSASTPALWARRFVLSLALTVATSSFGCIAVWTHHTQVTLPPDHRSTIDVTGASTLVRVENCGEGMAWLDVRSGGNPVTKTQLLPETVFERWLSGPVTIRLDSEPTRGTQIVFRAKDATGLRVSSGKAEE